MKKTKTPKAKKPTVKKAKRQDFVQSAHSAMERLIGGPLVPKS